MFGDHTLCCISARTRLHNDIRDTFAGIARTAHLTPQTEHYPFSTPGYKNKHLDVAYARDDKVQLVDWAVTHPLQASGVSAAAEAPGGAATRYQKVKENKYLPAINAEPEHVRTSLRLVPMVIDTFGALGEMALAELHEVVSALQRHRADVPPSVAAQLAYHEVIFTAMRGIAKLLLANTGSDTSMPVGDSPVASRGGSGSETSGDSDSLPDPLSPPPSPGLSPIDRSLPEGILDAPPPDGPSTMSLASGQEPYLPLHASLPLPSSMDDGHHEVKSRSPGRKPSLVVDASVSTSDRATRRDRGRELAAAGLPPRSREPEGGAPSHRSKAPSRRDRGEDALVLAAVPPRPRPSDPDSLILQHPARLDRLGPAGPRRKRSWVLDSSSESASAGFPKRKLPKGHRPDLQVKPSPEPGPRHSTSQPASLSPTAPTGPPPHGKPASQPLSPRVQPTRR